MNQRGFTLLETLVATLIMGVAVVGLMAEINASMRNATRVTDRDRAALLARYKMDELLAEPNFPVGTLVRGPLDPALTGGVGGGWTAQLTRFDMPPVPAVKDHVLDRMDLEIWWMDGSQRRTFRVAAYRTDVLRPEDMP
ncbi:MAG TPA: prepilin-type N-terminal cleavage/methylation domain-containing protein [Bryobacteraceae bacterium]|nr:prepilin-type N-terminal cleavage/methylation domain-containing protein [Bryobacteraceae bacterium]